MRTKLRYRIFSVSETENIVMYAEERQAVQVVQFLSHFSNVLMDFSSMGISVCVLANYNVMPAILLIVMLMVS